jgi:acyl carrier protein
MRIDNKSLAREIISRISEPSTRRRLEDQSYTLSDLGYDSISVVELTMLVEAELKDRGVTTDFDDDLWSVSSVVSEVESDIATLLDGRDLN